MVFRAVAGAPREAPVDARVEVGLDVVGAAAGLVQWFVGHERIIVAFSGGADSALVLAAAARALGTAGVVAVTASSASLATGELEAAAAFAASLGVEHRAVGTDEMSVEGYAANSGQRCYFCKATLLDTLAPLAASMGGTVVTGTNADDRRSPFRPGMRAATERGVREPLAETGLTKDQVRAISRSWGLATSDKPAAACLSSRVAHGLRITPARLARVDAAEAVVRRVAGAAGVALADLRVRDLGEAGARVEVDDAAVRAVAALDGLGEALAVVGFDGVVQVRAFRSGSMNLLPT